MNLEVVRRTPGYAESQIRLLISDLKSQSHNNKIKSVKAFQAYVEKYKPDIYDDDIDYLYTGEMDGVQGVGLLAWCGADSEKHGGQLKRIAAPCIELLHNLVTMDFGSDNLFYERFVVLPTSELVKINFVKHITQDGGGSKLFGDSRAGDGQDAMKLLAVLMQDHRTHDGNPMPLDIAVFFGDNRMCRERFTQYLQRSTTENISKAITKLKGARSDPAYRENRPKVWSEVQFKPLPLQEGEENFVDRGDVDLEPPPVRDPLGLSVLDLRATQQLLSRGGRAVQGGMRTIQLLQAQGAGKVEGTHDDDEEDEEGGGEARLSVLPTDKEFSASHFLTTVHPSASFSQLRTGLDSLCELLLQQSGERDMLVRVHFGLFVHCVEGLDWLKAFRLGQQRRVEGSAVTNFKKPEKKVLKKGQGRQLYKSDEQSAGSGGNVVIDALSSYAGKDGGEARLLRAIGSLAMVKREVKMTLTPIVDRMTKNRRIRKTEKVLRRLAATLEYPSRMRAALEAGDFDEVISIYQRVRALPMVSAMRILQKVVAAADEVAAKVRAIMAERLAVVYSDYTQLLRLAGVVRAMDGRRAYVDCLHASFRTHQHHFVKEMNKIYSAFCQAASTAHAQALERETTRKLKGDFGSERLANIMKSSSSGGDLASLGAGSAALGAGSSPLEPRVRRGRRHKLGADLRRTIDDDNASDLSSDDEIEGELDDLLLEEEGGALEGGGLGRGSDDFAVDSSSVARLSYVQAVVDLVELWLPSLHALAATVAVDADQAISVAGALSAVLAGKGGLSAGEGGLDKEYLKPSRDLGTMLLKIGEIVKQAIAGYTTAPITFRSAAAGSKGWKALKATLSIKGPGAEAPQGHADGAAAEAGGGGVDKMHSAVFGSPSFLCEMSEPYLRSAISEVSSLFESIEAVLQSVVVGKMADTAQRSLNHTSSTPIGKTNPSATPANPNPNPTYGDALAAFENVARDGDVSTAGALIAKLLRFVLGKQAAFGAREASPTDRLVAGGRPGNPAASGRAVDLFADASTMVQTIRSSGTSVYNSVQSSASDERHAENLLYKPLYCERCVIFVQQLIFKALTRIRERVLRPSWVEGTVVEGVAKILIGHVTLLASTYDSFSNRSVTVISKTGNDISELVSLDSSLRSGADMSADRQLLLLDLLRSLLMLRSHIILLLLSSARAVFGGGTLPSAAPAAEGAAEGEAALRERLVSQCLKGAGESESLGSKRLVGRSLVHYVRYHCADSEACVLLAIGHEARVVGQYISARRRDFRVLLVSAYTIIAASEARDQWLQRVMSEGEVSSGGQMAPARLPLHVSRLLLMLVDEKSRLRHVWGDVTVEGGFRDPLAAYNPREVAPPPSELESLESLLAPSAAKEKTLAAEPLRYCDHLLREGLRALLDEYSSLAASLASGTLPGAPAGQGHGGFALSAAKAAEEREFLRLAVAPLLPLPAPSAPPHKRDAARYPLAEQLLEAGRPLVSALRK